MSQRKAGDRGWHARSQAVALVLALILPVGLAAGKRQDSASPTHDMHGENGAAEPEWHGLTASMEKMQTGMESIKPLGNGDIDFVRLMLPHHQAAIDMAKAELLYGKDAQMRRLAQEIITDQQSEIELMRLWLKQHTPVSR